jgi:hypothetical protein
VARSSDACHRTLDLIEDLLHGPCPVPGVARPDNCSQTLMATLSESADRFSCLEDRLMSLAQELGVQPQK